jgi:putative tryptophan/tyrosine transport system substrate-binding protein
MRLIGFGLAIGLALASLSGEAQRARIPRIGVLDGTSASNPRTCVQFLRRGLSELGYIEGQTIVLEVRWAEGRSDVFPKLAAELVQSNVDLIVSAAGTAATAVKQATTSIPIVPASSFYPVEMGIVASLAHPGGNVTGLTHFTPELMAKRVQLLKDAVPAASRVAVLRLPGRVHDLVVKDMEAAARQLSVRLQVIEVQRAEDLERAFKEVVRGGAQAVMSTQSPFFFENNRRIADLAIRYRLPSLSGEPDSAEAGALLFYGPHVTEGCQHAAKYVDRILKGTKPADLPVEQPTKFELVINLKTAKALGLTIPQSILVRADEIIQ